MHSYIDGAYKAFEALAKRFVVEKIDVVEGKKRVNIIGATPLDFSVNKSVESMKELLESDGFEVVSTWAMGSTLEDIKKSSTADVNLVVSYSGMGAAKYLYEKFGIPYVVGTPFGKKFAEIVLNDLNEAIKTKENKIAYKNRKTVENADITIIGESIMSESLACAIAEEKDKTVKVISALETDERLLLEGDCIAMDEEEITSCLKGAKAIIADPLYKPICPVDSNFISLPHEGFSGRIYRDEIPNIINKIL